MNIISMIYTYIYMLKQNTKTRIYLIMNFNYECHFTDDLIIVAESNEKNIRIYDYVFN